MSSTLRIFLSIWILAMSLPITAQQPGSRTLMDAHNCYPYDQRWNDRIDRAIATGTPLAIEQDLAWYVDPKSGQGWSVVSHSAEPTGQEPRFEHYFFDRVRPIVEEALRKGNHGNWPLITLNLDFKDNKPEHLAAVRALLLRYRNWISEAPRTTEPGKVEPLSIRPILVLTGESDAQQAVFYDALPTGAPLLAFGAIHSENKDPRSLVELIASEKATNYRRWWNNSWRVIEPETQPYAGAWTPEKDARLRAFVTRAHAQGLWIRFYTLDGATEKEQKTNGWFGLYNFASFAAAETRWRAARAAGVDYLASDQYELLARSLRQK